MWWPRVNVPAGIQTSLPWLRAAATAESNAEASSLVSPAVAP
jgi:hypothetical protein